MFLPTKCLSLLEVLCKARPNHCILAADFDELPETTIAGKNAPLVASTVSPYDLEYGTAYLAHACTLNPVCDHRWHSMEHSCCLMAHHTCGMHLG